MTIEFDPIDIASPKRSQFGDRRAIADWYGYYAGYSVDFVRDVISVLKPSSDGFIVDPWNGAGTTTSTASLLGYRSYGNDINPVMSILSRARSARNIDADSLIERVKRGLEIGACASVVSLPWFSEETNSLISLIRNLCFTGQLLDPTLLTDESCLILTALFGTLRQFLAPLQGTNPTWWKTTYANKISENPNDIKIRFLAALEELLIGLDRSLLQVVDDPPPPIIRCGEASALSLPSHSACMIVTSPPYLTRLDYAKSMLMELMLINIEGEKFRTLRQKMTGSVMGGTYCQFDESWGSEAEAVLDHAMSAALERNRSDGRYYSGTFRRYFKDLFNSIKEMDRILVKGGSVAIVVQGSRHRGRIVDLPLVVQQMAESVKWETVRAVAWPTRDLGQINPRSREYGHHLVLETAVLLKKL